MKYLKMLGLAALAALALMAFFGAGSASGAVLCKTNTDPCEAGQDLKVGDTFTVSLESGTSSVLKAAFSEVKCNTSHLGAEITNTGGEGKSVEAKVTEFSLTECSCGSRTMHVTTTSLGTLKIDSAGTVTSISTRFTTQCTGLASCIFGTVAGGTDIGKFTESAGGGTATLDSEATLTWSSGEGDSGQFVCAGFGDTATWTASYQFTSPDPLYHSKT